MTLCPCCSKRNLEDCCGPIIAGAIAPTAEALVRSRYTAFVMRNLDHVESTHAPEIRDDFNRAEAERIAEEVEWQGLHIQTVKEVDGTAEIGYVVNVRHDQKTSAKGSLSRFRRENGAWFYVSSKPAPHLASIRTTKIGRNDPCTCGSGKKFKKCCANAVEQRTP